MLWTIVAVVLVMWALGLGFGIGGNLIHILLVVALVVLILNVLQGAEWLSRPLKKSASRPWFPGGGNRFARREAGAHSSGQTQARTAIGLDRR